MNKILYFCLILSIASDKLLAIKCLMNTSWLQVYENQKMSIFSHRKSTSNCVNIRTKGKLNYIVDFISKYSKKKPIRFKSISQCEQTINTNIPCYQTKKIGIILELDFSINAIFLQQDSNAKNPNTQQHIDKTFKKISSKFGFELIELNPESVGILLNSNPVKPPKNDISYLDEVMIILELVTCCLLFDISLVLLFIKRKSRESLLFHRMISILGLTIQILVELKFLYDFRFDLFEVPIMYLLFAGLLLLTVLMVLGVGQGLYLFQCLRDKYVYNDIRGVKRFHRWLGWIIFMLMKAHLGMTLYVYILHNHYHPSLFLKSIVYADAGLVCFFLCCFLVNVLLRWCGFLGSETWIGLQSHKDVVENAPVDLQELRLLIHRKNPTRNYKTFLLENYYYVIDCNLFLHLGGQFLVERIDGWDITPLFYGVSAMQRVPLPGLTFTHSHHLISPKTILQRRYKKPPYFFVVSKSVEVFQESGLFKFLPEKKPVTQSHTKPAFQSQRKTLMEPRDSLMSFKSRTRHSQASSKMKKPRNLLKKISKYRQKPNRYSKNVSKHVIVNKQSLWARKVVLRKELQRKKVPSRTQVSIRSLAWHSRFEWRVLKVGHFRNHLQLRVSHDLVDVSVDILNDFVSLLGQYFLVRLRGQPGVYHYSPTTFSLASVLSKTHVYLQWFLFVLGKQSNVFNIRISPIDKNVSDLSVQSEQHFRVSGHQRLLPTLSRPIQPVFPNKPDNNHWGFETDCDLFVGHSYDRIEYIDGPRLKNFLNRLKFDNFVSFKNIDSETSGPLESSDDEQTPLVRLQKQRHRENFNQNGFFSTSLTLLVDASQPGRSPMGLFPDDLLSSQSELRSDQREPVWASLGGPFGCQLDLSSSQKILFVLDDSGLLKFKDFLFFLNLRLVLECGPPSQDSEYLDKITRGLNKEIGLVTHSPLRDLSDMILSELNFFILTKKSRFSHLVYPLLSSFAICVGKLNPKQLIQSLVI